MNEKIELLKKIRISADKNYISDLRNNIAFTYLQVNKILFFSIDDYSLDEWNNAIKYINQKDLSFNTKKEAKKYLYIFMFIKARLNDL